MKYVALDIETTGLLVDYHQIVEVGLVLDDLQSLSKFAAEQLPSLRILVAPEDGDLPMNVTCAKMHRKLWEELEGVQQDVLDEEGWYDESKWDPEAPNVVFEALNAQGPIHTRIVARPGLVQTAMYDWLAKMSQNYKPEDNQIVVAGKNVASFDVPFMRALPGWDPDYLDFHRRTIDPGVFFMDKADRVPPSLSMCLARANLPTGIGLHEALHDAQDVVRLVRAGMNRLPSD